MLDILRSYKVREIGVSRPALDVEKCGVYIEEKSINCFIFVAVAVNDILSRKIWVN